VILVDTSVWIDHFRRNDRRLAALLELDAVLTHPFVVGESALGDLRQRELILGTLQRLPQIGIAINEEVLRFIGEHRLFGLGIGYVDAHLLAATRLTAGTSLWTRDKQLHAAAEALGLAYHPAP
jgi:predicted nucleic acid-binding protein